MTDLVTSALLARSGLWAAPTLHASTLRNSALLRSKLRTSGHWAGSAYAGLGYSGYGGYGGYGYPYASSLY